MEIEKAWCSKDWVARFGGYQLVTAPSKAAARELAYQTMEQMVSGDYRARVLIYRNLTAVVWRQPDGWAYSIATDDADGRVAFACSSHSSADGDETERQARSHMAQWATSEGPELTDHSAFILDDGDRAEYVRWLAWQRAVREALALGMDNEAARAVADRARYAA